ncbi:MAG: TrkH family potassium uptake protein [Clostridium perfringens]|nr:TrkH family potassium uptake protein [Clostridium perfringens]
MYINITKKIKLSAVQILAIGFLSLIIIGGIILSLPISSASGQGTDILDSFFTSTSAVCVTGLVTLDTATHWNYFGKTVIIILIQIGGLGFMSFTTLFALILKKKITLRERLVMQEAMNTFGIQGLVRLMRYILIFTFSIEIIGAALYATQFIPQFGVLKGGYYSLFASISAFCNAGFDLMGNFSSITSYATNVTILLNTSALIIIGGLGFSVWSELYNFKNYKKLSVNTKVVLVTTGILLIGGTILMFLFEHKNAKTIGNMSIINQITNSFFASVTTRTAGLNSIPLNDMTGASKFLTMILMFIGGSPGSTAGGIKTTTLAIIVLTLISIIKGREDTEVFGKRIARDTVQKAFLVFMLGSGIVLGVTLILTITQTAPLESLLFESISAFGTVGLTLGVTPHLTAIGKIVIMITMYLGRVGPMTVVLALTRKKKKRDYRYPEDKILIG